jgi:hypothetical protein
MKALGVAILALLATGALAATTETKPKDYSRLFKVLETPDKNKGDTSIDTAVGKFDSALAKSRSGDRNAIQSNLEYNREKLQDLRARATAQAEYVRTFWERVAIHFENLKRQFGGDENSKEYRKAALALKEEYEQREAEAKRTLEQLNGDIARVELRISELSTREKLTDLEDDLRSTDLGIQATLDDGKTKPLPSRADQALDVLSGLAQRKVERRIGLLVGSAPVQSAADHYFEKQIEDLLQDRK